MIVQFPALVESKRGDVDNQRHTNAHQPSPPAELQRLQAPVQPLHKVSKDSKDAQDFPRSRKPHNTGKTKLRVLGVLTTRGLIFYISVGKFRTSAVKVQASQPNFFPL
jgi:hypothetical protein